MKLGSEVLIKKKHYTNAICDKFQAMPIFTVHLILIFNVTLFLCALEAKQDSSWKVTLCYTLLAQRTVKMCNFLVSSLFNDWIQVCWKLVACFPLPCTIHQPPHKHSLLLSLLLTLSLLRLLISRMCMSTVSVLMSRTRLLLTPPLTIIFTLRRWIWIGKFNSHSSSQDWCNIMQGIHTFHFLLFILFNLP